MQVLDYTDPGSGLTYLLRNTLENDHAAAASGEVWRFASSIFVHQGPFNLFVTLATLYTLGIELEEVLGFGTFWAVYYLTAMVGSLADAALSELPVTEGSAASVAGLVGAICVTEVRSWALQEECADRPGNSSSQGLAPEDGEEIQKTEIEVVWGVKYSGLVTTRAARLINICAAVLLACNTLLDVGEVDSTASWYGVACAFWTGLLLTWFAGPRYSVERRPSVSALRGLDGQPVVSSLRQLERGLASALGTNDEKPVVVVVDNTTGTSRQPIVFAVSTVLLGAGLIAFLYVNGSLL